MSKAGKKQDADRVFVSSGEFFNDSQPLTASSVLGFIKRTKLTTKELDALFLALEAKKIKSSADGMFDSYLRELVRVSNGSGLRASVHGVSATCRRSLVSGFDCFDGWASEATKTTGRLTKGERLALFSLSLSLLIKHFNKNEIPVSLSSISKNLDKIPGVVGNSFPGYATNGLLGWVVRRAD